MAYAALVSLEDTIRRILSHHLFYISLAEKKQISSLLEHVNSFQGILEEFPDNFNNLEGRMRELADEAEVVLEYLVLAKVSSDDDYPQKLPLKIYSFVDVIKILEDLFPSSNDEIKVQLEKIILPFTIESELQLDKVSSSSDDDQLEQRLERVMGEIGLLARDVEKIKGGFSNKDFQYGVGSSALGSSSNASEGAPPIGKDAMVGFEDYVIHVKERLCAEQSELQFIPICGMGGIGKTTLAKNVYDDPFTMGTFDIRVWIIISQNYSARGIFLSLLSSLKEFDTGRLGKTDEEKVYKILKYRKYLVVMDDIWSTEAWDAVRGVFPDDNNGSRVVLTTRLSDVASYPDNSSKLCEMQLMDGDQSWNLFKQKVFANEECPFELENIGKEIARSCKGLPLAIVVIAGLDPQ